LPTGNESNEEVNMNRYLAGALILFAACGTNETNVAIFLDDKALVSCEKATTSELLDGQQPGGFRINCAQPAWSMAFDYDTRTRKDGTIKSITFSYSSTIKDISTVHPFVAQVFTGGSGMMSPAIAANAPDGPQCESAKALNRTTGEAPIPRKGKGIEPGEYKLSLANPCSTLKLVVK
jgi:hypothetical protein